MNRSIAQSRVAAVLLLAAVIPASPLHQDLPVHGPRVDAGRHLMPLRGGVANPAAQEHDSEGRAGTADLGALVRGPYDPEEHPNPLGDSSTTLSDVSSDVPVPEEAQRQIRQLFKEHEAMHGPLPLDQYVGQTFPVLERVLDQSEYRTYWRPGIVNKRLWAAAETGDDEEIEFLHQYLDADVNAVDLNIRNYTALFWAAMNGHHSTVDLLLKLGADITATDTHGSTPLHYAADRGWPLVVEALCAAGCGPWRRNSFGRTALEWALDFVAPYDASRTPIEDKLRLRAARLRPVVCGSNLETIWVLRRCMGLAPLDKLHRTGELARYKTYIREHEAAVRSRQRAPRTVFDMPPLLPDGTAFDDAIILDRLPRKFSSPFYKAPSNPADAVWPEGYPARNKDAAAFGWVEEAYPHIPRHSNIRRPWMLSGEVRGTSRSSTQVDEEDVSPPDAPPPPPAPPPPAPPSF